MLFAGPPPLCVCLCVSLPSHAMSRPFQTAARASAGFDGHSAAPQSARCRAAAGRLSHSALHALLLPRPGPGRQAARHDQRRPAGDRAPPPAACSCCAWVILVCNCKLTASHHPACSRGSSRGTQCSGRSRASHRAYRTSSACTSFVGRCWRCSSARVRCVSSQCNRMVAS